jgi:3'-phosphoadenosine 5'-phosphosulfate (PAPS) 3'-phosphatase
MCSPLDPSSPLAHELEVAIRAARDASEAILKFYDANSVGVYTKGDGSPVTDADLAADSVIRGVLTASFPGDALMTEEGETDTARLANPRVWIVDPIDGTAEYVARTGRFDVLIALAVDGEPAVAVTLQPTTGLMHAAVAGQGAWRHANDSWEPYRLAPVTDPPRIVASKYYITPETERALAKIASALGAKMPPVMDVGFQPRALDDAERWYDIFLGFPQNPRIFAAREWDIAASDLIMCEAGGVLTDAWGRHHRYNKRDTHIAGGLVVSTSLEAHARLIDALAPHLPEKPPAPDPADDLTAME